MSENIEESSEEGGSEEEGSEENMSESGTGEEESEVIENESGEEEENETESEASQESEITKIGKIKKVGTIDGILDDMDDLNYRLASVFPNYSPKRVRNYERAPRERRVYVEEYDRKSLKSQSPSALKNGSEFYKAVHKYQSNLPSRGEKKDSTSNHNKQDSLSRLHKKKHQTVDFDLNASSKYIRPEKVSAPLIQNEKAPVMYESDHPSRNNQRQKKSLRSLNPRSPEGEYRDPIERERPADSYFRKLYKKPRIMNKTASTLYRSRPKLKMLSDDNSKFLSKRRSRDPGMSNFDSYIRRADKDRIMSAMRVLSKKGL